MSKSSSSSSGFELPRLLVGDLDFALLAGVSLSLAGETSCNPRGPGAAAGQGSSSSISRQLRSSIFRSRARFSSPISCSICAPFLRDWTIRRSLRSCRRQSLLSKGVASLVPFVAWKKFEAEDAAGACESRWASDVSMTNESSAANRSDSKSERVSTKSEIDQQ